MLKRILPFLFMAICLPTFSQVYLKHKCKKYLNKTALIITETHKQELHKVEDQDKKGYFARSVKHQRFARTHYILKNYQKSLWHSHYARELAFKVWVHSNRQPFARWNYTKDEALIVSNGPSVEVLEKELKDANPDITFEDDPYVTDDEIYELTIDD